jgi:hypothetical protein
MGKKARRSKRIPFSLYTHAHRQAAEIFFVLLHRRLMLRAEGAAATAARSFCVCVDFVIFNYWHDDSPPQVVVSARQPASESE